MTRPSSAPTGAFIDNGAKNGCGLRSKAANSVPARPLMRQISIDAFDRQRQHAQFRFRTDNTSRARQASRLLNYTFDATWNGYITRRRNASVGNKL